MHKNVLQKYQKELLEIYDKLSPIKQEHILDFVKWVWKEKPKKKTSLKGILSGLKITEKDLAEARISLFSKKSA